MKKILEFFLGKSRNKQIVDLVGLDRIELSRDLKVQANQAVAQGRWDEAAQLYEKAILANSADASLLVGLGFSHLQAVRPKQALATLLQAIRVLPNSQDAWFLAGKAQIALGLEEDAAKSWRRLLAVNPDFLPVYPDILQLLVRLGCAQEAMEIALKAAERVPDCFEYQLYHANLLVHAHQTEAAIPYYLQALKINPSSADVLANLGVACRQSGDLERALNYSRQAMQLNSSVPDFYSNYLFLLQSASDASVQDKFLEHRRYAKIFEEPYKNLWASHQNRRDLSKVLRIGYVSGDFCDHALRFFIEPVLKNHNHDRFEIHCYYTNRIDDEHTKRLRSYADRWVDCWNWNDGQLFSDIQDQQIDILVDLSGHTAHNRLPVFAKKPAPIQMTWLGYQSTTGLTAIDWRITDHSLDPVGMTERFNSERLLRLPAAGVFAIDDNSPVFRELPCLTGKQFTFGCLHNPSKVTMEALDAWAEILLRAPATVLLMGNSTSLYAQKVRQRMGRKGVSSDRLIFVERLSLQGYLALHQRIDLMLDTFPYNGGTTTLHAIGMGLPTIVLGSESAISRVGMSIMQGYGLSEFCCLDIEDYVVRAVDWSQRCEELANLRKILPERVAKQNARLALEFTQGLEKAWRDIWEDWCKTSGETR
ncbi:putative O-linked N-acetylglucosamine transferase (SPINDLY family) [Delftia sp. 60]|uniref:O-linked N-acetylglucosamine transferase, SPINDLY family protein n=1 Tax=Delftia sp. 60 TaxID=2035216 RepID=UPI000C18FDBC|nr:tetratricopeptide repeat protein [Delftia sp. 60]PIF40250.1 putative O-linked N-acetylglucosamine transferase (SPINDLY family) [Burkholderiales bacterium 23]PIF64567.1 putative O-linked N-acetylglucosamine transferase (SPINDLY family) [Delftia sp. 60]